MSEESKDTLPDNRNLLEAINLLTKEFSSFRDEMRQEVSELRQEVNAINKRLNNLELNVEEIKNSQFSVDVRLEREEGSVFKNLSIAHNLRADVKVLGAEVIAWAKDVSRLEKQII